MVEVALVVMLSAVKAADLPPGAVLRLGDARWRAGGPVLDLALSPDGTRFVTARRSDFYEVTVTVWDADTGRAGRSGVVNVELYRRVAWGPGGAAAVVWRADPAGPGQKLGTLSPDDFRVWDFADPKAAPPPLLPTAFGGIGCGSRPGFVDADRPAGGPEFPGFAPSPDGSRVAAVRKGPLGTYRVDVFESKPTDSAARLTRVRALDPVAGDPGALLLSPGGRTVVGFRRDRYGRRVVEARAWDVATGKAGAAFPCSAEAREAALSPDGRTLAVAGYGGVSLLDPMTGGKRAVVAAPAEPDDPSPSCDRVAYFPDGARVVAASGPRAFVAEVATGKVLGTLAGHAAYVTAVAVSADGKRVATADAAGLVRVWDAATLRPLTPAAGHRMTVDHAELSPDGTRLLTWAPDETVRVWDLKTGREVRAIAGVPWDPCGGGLVAQRPTFTPDGLSVVFSTKERLVARDVLTGAAVPLPGGLAGARAGVAVFAPDGKAVVTWARYDYELVVWDWPSGRVRFRVPPEPWPDVEPGFAPDGSAVFVHPTSPLRWDARTGRPLPPAWKADDAPRERDLLRALRPNPRLFTRWADDEIHAAAAGTGKTVPGSRVLRPPGESGPFFGQVLALSATGRQYAFADEFDRGRIYVYEAASGELRRDFSGHRGEVRVLGFTPDGTKLLTAGADHTVLVWDVRPRSLPLPDPVKREASAAKLWARMCAGQADASYLAMARLAAEPDAAVKTARLRMRPASAPTAAALDRLLRQLGDPDFRAREAAEAALDGHGEPAAELVKGRLAKLESAEARRRAEGFVTRWVGGGRDAVRLADARAVELLEALGTPAAKEFLKELAAGDPAAWRTQEAKRAVERAK
ncbi:MAG: hypothetical protein C0501_19250 [Isosphaera sp.]|nr:hypothetical protein [Isosphaera sp.]